MPGACVCPPEMVLKYPLSNICVYPDECSCTADGVEYDKGDVIKYECSECVCQGKTWECHHQDCPAICYSVGSHIYKTFDDLQYHFGGRCGYTMLQTTDELLEIRIEDVLCGTSNSVCAKNVFVLYREDADDPFIEIELIRGQGVRIDGSVITQALLDSIFTVMTGFRVRSVGYFIVISINTANTDVIIAWDGSKHVFLFIFQITVKVFGK